MPAHYVDMNKDEMEYEGTGTEWFDGVLEACVAGAIGGGTLGACYGVFTGPGWPLVVAGGAVGGAGTSMVGKLIENVTGESVPHHIDNIGRGIGEWFDSWRFW